MRDPLNRFSLFQPTFSNFLRPYTHTLWIGKVFPSSPPLRRQESSSAFPHCFPFQLSLSFPHFLFHQPLNLIRFFMIRERPLNFPPPLTINQNAPLQKPHQGGVGLLFQVLFLFVRSFCLTRLFILTTPQDPFFPSDETLCPFFFQVSFFLHRSVYFLVVGNSISLSHVELPFLLA